MCGVGSGICGALALLGEPRLWPAGQSREAWEDKLWTLDTHSFPYQQVWAGTV
jgi:hypothetical protein